MKPAHVWSLFALCLIVVVLAMAWSSAIVLRLEHAESAAQAQAALEENARLALWRMDSTATALLAEERARPYFHYRAFYATSSAYTNMFAVPQPSDPLFPSPLLRDTPEAILLHFQRAPSGDVTSPQVPTGTWRELALREKQTNDAVLTARTSRLSQVRATLTSLLLARVAQRDLPARPPVSPALVTKDNENEAPSQKMKNAKEYSIRKEYSTRQQAAANMNKVGDLDVAQVQTVAPPVVVGANSPVDEGAMTPYWIGDSLLLARQVRVNGATYLQGCWVDWPRLSKDLLGSVSDLLPHATLERASTETADDERRLAALPVRLVPGDVPLPPAPLSPVRLSLVGAWAFLLLAAVAVAALLQGVMALSERRRVFVSAVTHELRTPLTTFRLYTDMMAEGMVTGEEKKREYLGRLQREAHRLGHLVENVLFYARLDSGRGQAVRESVNVPEVLRETAARLSERTERVGLRLEVEASDETPLRVRVDRAALEQILVNLVDNACKYAAASDPPVVTMSAVREDGRGLIRVRDQGPGLSPTERRRLFRPFSKSDREAADSAPGVGLGLALSRRLARAQGGDLKLEDRGARGATFALSLPLDPTEPA